MIIAADDKKADPATEPLIGPSTSTAPPVPELEPPPSFQESIAAGAAPDTAQQKPYSYYDGNLADSDVFVPPGGEEPPPFTPYEAEFFVSGDSIISHDKHLNEDGERQSFLSDIVWTVDECMCRAGEALYRFLLSHAGTPPTFCVHLRGTHTESRTRSVSRRDNDGHYRTHHEHYTEDIIGAHTSVPSLRLTC